jgi:hypothetical protein
MAQGSPAHGMTGRANMLAKPQGAAAVGHPPTAKVAPPPGMREPDAQPGNGQSRCTLLRCGVSLCLVGSRNRWRPMSDDANAKRSPRCAWAVGPWLGWGLTRTPNGLCLVVLDALVTAVPIVKVDAIT